MRNMKGVIAALVGAGVCGLVIIVLVAILGSGEPGDPVSQIVRNVGGGFLVASVVGITVELYVRRQMRLQMDRMLREVRTDVFEAVLGHEFPESIWEQVSSCLLLSPVMRKNVSLDYVLENLTESHGDFIQARVCWSYVVCNLDRSREWVYPVVAVIDRCLGSSEQTRITRVEVDGEPVSEENLDRKDNETEVSCKTSVTLPRAGSRRVTVHGESVYRTGQVVTFSMADPTENLVITISNPPSIAVRVDPLHTREERLEEQPAASPESHRSWMITGGLLPGHGVSIKWFPSRGTK